MVTNRDELLQAAIEQYKEDREVYHTSLDLLREHVRNMGNTKTDEYTILLKKAFDSGKMMRVSHQRLLLLRG